MDGGSAGNVTVMDGRNADFAGAKICREQFSVHLKFISHFLWRNKQE